MAKFCCCLPLRLGTLLIAFFEFLFNGLGAAGTWMVLAGTRISVTYDGETTTWDYQMNNKQKIVTIISGVVLTIGAIISLIGFIGAITKKLRLVRILVGGLAYLLGFHLGTGIVNIVIYAVNKKDVIKACQDQIVKDNKLDALEGHEEDACNFGYRVVLYALIALLVVPLLLNIYALWVVRDYAKELEGKAVHKTAFNLTAPVDASYKYSKAATHEDGAAQPLTHDQYSSSYPYSDPNHSYGNQPYNNPYSK